VIDGGPVMVSSSPDEVQKCCLQLDRAHRQAYVYATVGYNPNVAFCSNCQTYGY